ncbi:MAG: murein L,D-transpeptidase [Ilumatobacteraceae bacterium]|nr:murein L,D-transpeptidase [Ilumatobacteraceae bacterium]
MRHRSSTLWFTAVPVGALVLVGCGAAMISSAAAPVAVTLIEPEAPAQVVVVEVPEVAVTTTSVAPAPTTTTTTVAPTTTLVERETQMASPLEQPLVAISTDSGPEAARVQQRLVDLGFWLQSTDGEFGVTSRQATMAFQKYYGLTTSGEVDQATADLLSGLVERPMGRAEAGTMFEVDKSLQLGFVIVDGSTQWVLNVSTGSEIPYEEPNQNDPSVIEQGDSITDLGLFAVDRERAEGWWDGDLGSIYRPKYFNGGIAVHGSYSIPDYPASHGCVRVSTAAMDWIWSEDLMSRGSAVWVHGEIPVE